MEFQVVLMAENGLGLVFQLGSLVLLPGEVERFKECATEWCQNVLLVEKLRWRCS